jgi:hypothetical protein
VLAVLAVLALVLYACSGSGSGKQNPLAKETSIPSASQSSVPTSAAGSSQTAASGGASGATSASGGAPSGSVSGGASGGATTAGGANGGTNAGASGGNPGGSPTGGATGSTGAPGCQLNLSLSTQATAYANGVNPQFTVAVVNRGTADCDVDVSPKSLVLNLYSGQDHIWSSADCATGGKDLRGIAPGAVQTVTYTWNRTRSSQGCTSSAGSAQLGTYFGVVSLGSGSGASTPAVQSQPKTFELKTGS